MTRARTGRRLGAGACAAALALSAPAVAPATAAPQPAGVQPLDAPGQHSSYVFVDERATVRAAPVRTARKVARIKLRTEDGTDELLLVLARATDAGGHSWLHVRLPVRPNNTTGWVPEAALGPLHPVHTWLKVDTRRLRATLVSAGRVVFRAPVGVGQPRWPTPRGEFYVRDKLSGYGSAGSIYGPLAFGTSARSAQLTDWPGGGVVGIHGTNEPSLIPGRISHGCVRMRNRDILRLARLMPVGTPLTIR